MGTFAQKSLVSLIAALSLSLVPAVAATNRITGKVDAARTRVLAIAPHPSAQARYDAGALDPATPLDHVMLMLRPSSAQQTELDALLAEQQNSSSPQFHKWLTPAEFGNRFGVSASDHSKIVAWLAAAGLKVEETGQGRNWIAFSGTAATVGRALHTAFHRFNVRGELHYANVAAPAVPEALATVITGIEGLHDFYPQPRATTFMPEGSDPAYNLGTSHYLVPQDFATVYNLAPLYTAGFDGTGQAIAVVGASAISLSDIRSFRSRYALPPNDPVLVPYAGDPGFNGAEIEGDLDVEWSGAVAPMAKIYYVYGVSVRAAVAAAVGGNLAPVITYSYGDCEIDTASATNYRAIWQQGNAQGITLVASSGDSGPACDIQGVNPYAAVGKTVSFPADLPETTAVGGTKFNEADGKYWAATNSTSFGSALSYIPEVAWNESAQAGLLASGGGASVLYTKPDWQAGPGVPNDGARDVPDLALSAAVHDAYYITYRAASGGVGGTSASAPSFAGIVALLNQYQIAKFNQDPNGLGNINPQLYRMAQTVPAAFHDITQGDNMVPCAQGSPDCLTGMYGYTAGPGYDLVTGLGSLDANAFVTQWNKPADPVIVTMATNAATYTLNDTVAVTAVVAAAKGSVVPTGTISFVGNGGVELAAVKLTQRGGAQIADLEFPAWEFDLTGTATLRAVYSGDAAFSGGAASVKLRINLPPGASGIIPFLSPATINANPPDAQGPAWQISVTLLEVNGVPSILTGFSINGQAQPLSQFFPATNIPARGSLIKVLTFRNITTPLTETFTFTGIDSSGNDWTRSVPVTFTDALQRILNFQMTAAPLTMQQNKSASAACQWSQRISIDNLSGFRYQIGFLAAGSVDISDQIPAILGTDRLAAWGSVQGTLCWAGATVPGSDDVFVELIDDFGDVLTQDLIVSFAPAAPAPSVLSVSPVNLTVTQPSGPPATLQVNPGSATQAWTASVFPNNRTTSWLTLSAYSGVGTGTISLRATTAGFEPGAYRATIVLQATGTVPQAVSVPVMLVYGPASGTNISSAVSALSFQPGLSPGSIMTVYGSGLAASAETASTLPLPFTLGSTSATVNGVAAPMFYSSSGQLNIQVPFEVGAGPAVLGVNNNGQVAGYALQIAPSAPAILSDGSGNLLPAGSGALSAKVVLYLSGAGAVTPALKTGYAPSSATTAANLPKVRLPLTVTVGGKQAFLDFAGVPAGTVGLVQVNFRIPATLAPGPQPVVVTVNGVASPPVNITVAAPGS